jgi:hypothetical protein
MQTHPTPLHRTLLALLLAAALLGLAPSTAAQKLTPTVGHPIAYRVSLPSGAEINDNGETLTAETENMIVFVGAVDLVAGQDKPLPVSDGESRRIMTSLFMGSDSLLFGLIDHSFREHDVDLTGAVREIRTLGGHRAAYVRGEFQENGEAAWMEVHLTVKDGIMYLLIVGGMRDNASVALASRIRESFVLADAPPPAEPGTRRSSVIRRIQESR